MFHRVTALTLCSFPYLLLYLAASTDSGFITPENHPSAVTLYPYDRILFHPDVECRTCRLVKPARSKHCSLCGHCVIRADHHCAWINNCVGYGNSHYFLLLLLSTAVLTTYGVFLGYGLLPEKLFTMVSVASAEDRPLAWICQTLGVRRMLSQRTTWRDFLGCWLWALARDRRVGSVALLCLSLGPMTFGLLGYHIYLIWAGMTTNENAKWSLWKADIAEGFVYMSTDDGGDGGRRPVRRVPNQALDSETSRKDNRWRKVSSISEVDNLYDRGFWANLMDVFPGRRLKRVAR